MCKNLSCWVVGAKSKLQLLVSCSCRTGWKRYLRKVFHYYRYCNDERNEPVIVKIAFCLPFEDGDNLGTSEKWTNPLHFLLVKQQGYYLPQLLFFITGGQCFPHNLYTVDCIWRLAVELSRNCVSWSSILDVLANVSVSVWMPSVSQQLKNAVGNDYSVCSKPGKTEMPPLASQSSTSLG